MKAKIILPSGQIEYLYNLTQEECLEISKRVVSGSYIQMMCSNGNIFAMNSSLVQNSYFAFVSEE